jgi:dTDP-glucose 4,6-dehydratase
VLEQGKLGEVYNVGGHNERTNIEIVTQIIDYVEKNIDDSVNESLIKHVTDRKGHDRRYAIDPAKISEELGWLPKTPFEEGIIKTLNWYTENSQWVESVTSGTYQNYYREMYEGR